MVLATTSSSPVLSAVGSLVLGLAVLVLLLYRQLRERPVRASPILPIVLLVFGFVELTSFARAHPLTAEESGLLGLSLLVFAVGLGAVRAWTVRLFVDGGRLMRKGSWVTVLLWLVAVGLHLGVDAVNGVGEASLLLYLGLTLGTQQLVVQWRAQKLRRA
ncbi:MAG: hypothetical protein ACYCX9_05140 [Candidatus Dormibacteria bacterium]|jgi:hypothetical protein